MTDIDLPLAGLALLSLLALAGAGFSWYQLRRVLPRRLQQIEDALRVYNSANANLGRQVAELEEALRQARAAPAAAARDATPRVAVQTAAERYGSVEPAVTAAAAPPAQPAAASHARAPRAEDGFSEAELRLAQLIKSRLSSLRLN